ncbi:hypothetical protein DENIS_0245 [Desulfonema ishimotonii]|uniref:Type 4 fimbrial biogenesis protein PilX N-terminal domain-containing protein n=1 Tax=Desulfonema ishimotonii TaxID=45657 RepID=A0A401FQR5_9BACT|nr:pilus assembly PilX N-terminal domain-containing protein [Desulfonema ishimotonii]GBC59308.1 hypothetical protein DENIS_0245 [Desulfonema ishimotonii]
MKFQFLYFRQVAADQRGMALIVSMLLLVILTVIGVASISTSNFDILISDAHKRQQAAFYAAEAGLTHGKATLAGRIQSGGTTPTWNDDILDGATDTDVDGAATLLEDQALGTRYTYTVVVYDNVDGGDPDNPAADDQDGTIILRSTSQPRNRMGGSATVEVALRGYYTFDTTFEGSQEGAGPNKDYFGDDAGAVDLFDDDGALNTQLGGS